MRGIIPGNEKKNETSLLWYFAPHNGMVYLCSVNNTEISSLRGLKINQIDIQQYKETIECYSPSIADTVMIYD